MSILTNPTIFYNDGQYLKFFPEAHMNNNEVLNSIIRLSVYSILVLCVTSTRYVIIPIIALILCIIIAKLMMFEEVNIAPRVEPKFMCQKPSEHNPFMNITLDDHQNNLDRPKACEYTDDIKSLSNKYFTKNLFTNVDDIYQNRSSQREFYTMPVTTIPNDQTGYAQWLFGNKETCKTNQEACLRYEDLKHKRFTNIRN